MKGSSNPTPSLSWRYVVDKCQSMPLPLVNRGAADTYNLKPIDPYLGVGQLYIHVYNMGSNSQSRPGDMQCTPHKWRPALRYYYRQKSFSFNMVLCRLSWELKNIYEAMHFMYLSGPVCICQGQQGRLCFFGIVKTLFDSCSENLASWSP